MATATAFYPTSRADGSIVFTTMTVAGSAQQPSRRSFFAAIPHHEWVAAIVLMGLVLLGAMEFLDWWAGHFVTWAHHMHQHWVNFWSIFSIPDVQP